MTRALVRGIGDVGSATAHALYRAGMAVVIHDLPEPSWTRRKMAFTDAVFDGSVEWEGVRVVRADDLASLDDALANNRVAVWVQDFNALEHALKPDILVDARMRKRHRPEPQRDLAAFTIGLGPNFIAGVTTHVVIETAWGPDLGNVIAGGTATAYEGGPKRIGGLGIERLVYSPHAGRFVTDREIGDRVSRGQVVARVGDTPIAAPLDGRLRGLTRSGVPVAKGTKVVEIDPRGDDAEFTGMGERPAKIAEGVLCALREWLPAPLRPA